MAIALYLALIRASNLNKKKASMETFIILFYLQYISIHPHSTDNLHL